MKQFHQISLSVVVQTVLNLMVMKFFEIVEIISQK